MEQDLSWLSEAQFTRLEPYLPTDTRGKPRMDDRLVISGMSMPSCLAAMEGRARGLWSSLPNLKLEELLLLVSFSPFDAVHALCSLIPQPACRQAGAESTRNRLRNPAPP